MHPRLLAVGTISAVPLVWILELSLSWDKTSVPSFGGAGAVAVMVGLLTLLLVARNRWPFTTLLTVIAAGAVITVAVPGFVPVFSTWLALFSVALRCPRLRSVAGLAVSFVTLGLNATAEIASQGADTTDVLMSALGAGILVHSAVFGLGRWVRWSFAQRRLVAALAAREASAAERGRIARDLHDIVAHSVSLMVIQASVAARTIDSQPGHARESLQHVGELGQKAVEDLRLMLGLLRREEPDEPAASGGISGAGELVRSAVRTGWDVQYTVKGEPVELEPAADAAGYRILQEALTNALKHGQGGTPVRVDVTWHPGGVHLELANVVGQTGAGALLSTGHGVAGMAARASSAGGFVETVDSGGDFRVRAAFPAAYRQRPHPEPARP